MNGQNNLAESYKDSLDGKYKWLTSDNEETDINVKDTSCPCCGLSEIDKTFITKLWRFIQSIEYEFDDDVIILSATRCEEHNKKVGGTYNSAHLPVTLACDLTIKNIDKTKLKLMFEMAKMFFSGIGIYTKNFIHVDIKKRNSEKLFWVKNDAGYKYFS